MAQNPNDDIVIKQFNHVFLEDLLEQQINNFRAANNLQLLETDEYLHLAAADQAKYMLKTNKIDHVQLNKKKETVRDRIFFYDGMHSEAGENCAKIVIGSKVKLPSTKARITLKSYQNVADYLFDTWKSVKGGAALLLNRNYYRVSTATEINPKEKSILITQVYASEPFELPKGVKLEKDDYKITPYSKEKCSELEKKYAYLPELMSDNLYFKHGEIYFYFHDLALLKQVLKNSNDAIALDIISRKQFSCNKGNQRYPSKIHSGVMLPPISKSYIFGKNELKDEGQVEVSLGPIPDFVDTNNVEFNLLIIKDNCLCQTIIYNSLPGENLKSLNLGFLIDTMSVSHQADSVMNKIEFIIPFEKNKFQYTYADIKPFLDSINLKIFDLKKIEVNAYSSIEGDAKKNKILQEKRANSILKAIKNYNLSDVETKITTQENWAGFFESIKGSPYENYFLNKPKDVIRKIINSDSLNINMEPYLEDQRMAKIELTVEKIFMDEELFKILPQKFNKAIKDKNYTKAKIYQSVMFSNIENGKIKKETVLRLKIPHLKETVSLNNNQIAFKWYYANTSNKDSLNKYLIRDIETQLLIDPTNPFLLYNKVVLKILLWTNKYSRVKEPKYLLKEIKSLYNIGIPNREINLLILNYNIISADFYYESKKFPEREKALKEVRNILFRYQLTRDQAFRVAYYFMFQMRINWAIEIMKPWVKKKNIDEEFLYTFLTIAIYNKKLVPEKYYIQLLTRAKNMDKQRFCKLFGFPNMSFQLLKDLDVKDLYCKTCH